MMTWSISVSWPDSVESPPGENSAPFGTGGQSPVISLTHNVYREAGAGFPLDQLLLKHLIMPRTPPLEISLALVLVSFDSRGEIIPRSSSLPGWAIEPSPGVIVVAGSPGSGASSKIPSVMTWSVPETVGSWEGMWPSPKGTWGIITNRQERGFLFDQETGRATPLSEPGHVHGVAFSPDNHAVAVILHDEARDSDRLWITSLVGDRFVGDPDTCSLSLLAFLDEGTVMFTRGDSHRAEAFFLDSDNKRVGPLPVPAGYQWHFSPNGRYMVWVGRTEPPVVTRARFFRLRNGTVLEELWQREFPDEVLQSASVSPGGRVALQFAGPVSRYEHLLLVILHADGRTLYEQQRPDRSGSIGMHFIGDCHLIEGMPPQDVPVTTTKVNLYRLGSD